MSPATHDGLKDISETHLSMRTAVLWPKKRSIKQKDLCNMSAYILHQSYPLQRSSALRARWAATGSLSSVASH